MSYGISAALQVAVFQHLTLDASLVALVGTDIYDALPSGVLPSAYVSLGPETVRNKSDVTGYGALHIFTVSVVTDVAGFDTAKNIGAAVSDALVDADLTLTRGQLVSLNFYRASAKRVGTGQGRRIDLTFHARVDDA